MDVMDWLARCPLVAILRGVRPDEVDDDQVVAAPAHDLRVATVAEARADRRRSPEVERRAVHRGGAL